MFKLGIQGCGKRGLHRNGYTLVFALYRDLERLLQQWYRSRDQHRGRANLSK